eukprot:CAMPEP_0118639798 /NCGR_PEP_ID=MMETSP0785-20121206/4415_1 /TAXON_ID=91992 /ORGANISM="Bolidomonas pacifica, Strain CCMP 1866" /LENGTH=764 /DNA_ID=CAMNT_0006531149 /DNA_START=119 /DNA_END=2410 /DNA_ORIENTATION=-
MITFTHPHAIPTNTANLNSDLNSLLQTCVRASISGCTSIRAVQSHRSSTSSLQILPTKEEEEEAAQYLTIADVRAQRDIVGTIKSTHPNANIIGEEDDSIGVGEGVEIEGEQNWDSLKELGLYGSSTSQAATTIVASDEETCIYVDPLDGTREFVLSNLPAVQSLIGVVVSGTPAVGVVGSPFVDCGVGEDKAEIIYAMRGLGVGRVLVNKDGKGGFTATDDGLFDTAKDILKERESNVRVVVTGDSRNKLLKRATEVCLDYDDGCKFEHVIKGGAGNKFKITALEGKADIAVMHFGTSKWDTAGWDVIVREAGGRMSDLFGNDIVYGCNRKGLKNDLGVVVSRRGMGDLHEYLCNEMKREKLSMSLLDCRKGAWRGGNEALDIARDLDGDVIDKVKIGECLGGKLEGYEARDDEAFRGMMSKGCRLRFSWADGSDTSAQPRTAFYKRVVMSELDHLRLKADTMPEKVKRDVTSYQVESNFLASSTCKGLASNGVLVPKCYDSDLRPNNRDPVKSKFSLLVSDFSPDNGWRQEGLFDLPQMKASLTTLARLHSYGWGGEQDNLKGVVWERGTYWSPEKQQRAQFVELGSIYKTHIERFGEDFKNEVNIEDIDGVGPRLEKIALDVAASAHPSHNAMKTLLHGDPKAANVFIREVEEGCYDAGMINFQWTGFGLVGTEVAHHIASSASPSSLDHEVELLDFYYTTLTSENPDVKITRNEFMEQYETGILDTCRLAFGYQWARADFGKDALNKNSYNKDMICAAWL